MTLEEGIANRPVTITDILEVVTKIINRSDYFDKEYITTCLQNHEEARLSNIKFYNEINVIRWKENEALKEELEALHKVLSNLNARKQKQIEVLQSELDDCCNESNDE